MADSDVQICNIALRRVQGEPITDLVTDTTKGAAICRTIYEPTRDAVLRDHSWSFAIRRQVLAASTDPNLTQFLYPFVEPADPWCLLPLVLLDPSSNYAELPGFTFQEEGRIIYTNLNPAALKYVARITDVKMFDANFVDALAWRLAADLIGPLNGKTLVEPMTMYQGILNAAKGNNDKGAKEPPLKPTSWVDSRFG